MDEKYSGSNIPRNFKKKKDNLLSHSVDFHPIAINHKPNSHVNILPAALIRT